MTPGLRPSSAPNIDRAAFVHERLGLSRSNPREHGSLMTPSLELRNGWRSSHLSNYFGHEPTMCGQHVLNRRPMSQSDRLEITDTTWELLSRAKAFECYIVGLGYTPPLGCLKIRLVHPKSIPSSSLCGIIIEIYN